MAFSEINVKAATITGAILGLLCWLLVVPYGFVGYGMMGYGSAFRVYGLLSVVLDAALGAIAGAVIGIIYNLALKLK